MDWIFFISIAVFHVVGVFLHELGHKIFCDLFEVKVFRVKYFNWHSEEDGVEGWVIHEKPKHLRQSFFITMGPMFTNGLILALFILVVTAFKINILFSIFYGIVIGLITSLFPSKPDIDNFLEHLRPSKVNLFVKSIGSLFSYFLFLFTSELVRMILAIVLAIGLLSFAPNIVDDMDQGYEVQKDCLKKCIDTYGNSNGFYNDNVNKKIEVEIEEVSYDKYICTCYNSEQTDGFQLEYNYE